MRVGYWYAFSMTRIQERGQVTLPKALRDAVGLAPGDEVTITVAGDGLIVRPARTIFSFQAPQHPPRQSARQQAAEKSAWADAAASDAANQRPDAA
jgi:AbrB family looped-hinge helix DNA binding protein